MDDARELRRLALLGLETEAKLARVDADTGDWFARSYGAFPDLEPDTEPARDTRAERIGRAVIAWVGDDEPKQLRSYASDLEADHWPVGADLVRAIAAALEEEA
jgi:hypothetical protein